MNYNKNLRLLHLYNKNLKNILQNAVSIEVIYEI